MVNKSNVEVGQVIRSNSHIDYVCEVYADVDRKTHRVQRTTSLVSSYTLQRGSPVKPGCLLE
jgi:hypothetical protein